MKWRSVFGIIPVPVFYTDDLPENVGGRALYGAIYIRPKYERDEGIHQHELAHIELLWATLWLHGIIKQFSRRYAVWNEAWAYRVQMQYRNLYGKFMSLDEAAGRLSSDHYGFGMTQEQAKQLLVTK
jgi:hypothetical protein